MMITKVHFVLLTVMSYCYDFVMLGSRQEPTATPEGHGSLFGKSKYQKLTGAGTTEKQVKKNHEHRSEGHRTDHRETMTMTSVQ